MLRFLFAILMLAPIANADHVVLLHGLARTHRSMAPLAKHLEGEGHAVSNLGYPSTSVDITTAAETVLAPHFEQLRADGASRIHFVTHSMGAIVLRDYLSRHALPELGHCVLLAPPSHGSEIVDKLGHWWLFRAINGTAGRQLGTDAKSAPNTLPQLTSGQKWKVGIVAGTRTLEPWLSIMLPGKDDGKVSVKSAHVTGCDNLAIPATHSFIMRKARTKKLVSHFLEAGSFPSE